LSLRPGEQQKARARAGGPSLDFSLAAFGQQIPSVHPDVRERWTNAQGGITMGTGLDTLSKLLWGYSSCSSMYGLIASLFSRHGCRRTPLLSSSLARRFRYFTLIAIRPRFRGLSSPGLPVWGSARKTSRTT
jgi:hypothetical protein